MEFLSLEGTLILFFYFLSLSFLSCHSHDTVPGAANFYQHTTRKGRILKNKLNTKDVYLERK